MRTNTTIGSIFLFAAFFSVPHNISAYFMSLIYLKNLKNSSCFLLFVHPDDNNAYSCQKEFLWFPSSVPRKSIKHNDISKQYGYKNHAGIFLSILTSFVHFGVAARKG